MIVSRLRGGLGNQLFQYAAGRAVAHRHRTGLMLDTSAMDTDALRWYALGHFRISASVVTQEERAKLGVRRAASGRIGRALERIAGSGKIQIVRENGFEFDPAVLRA